MTKSVLKIFIAIASGLLVLPIACFSEGKSYDNPKNIWFKPKLTINSDPYCSALLSATHAKFVSDDSDYESLVGFTRIEGPFQNTKKHNLKIEYLADDPRQFVLKTHNGTKLFGYFLNHGGCGGACETEQLLISNKKFIKDEIDERSAASTPVSPAWNLLEDSKGALYAQGMVDGHLQFYRIVSPENWHLSCDIALKPDKPQEIADPEIQPALKSIKSLIRRTGGLSRGAGNCGSMGTAWRWQREVEARLYETLYRPWALAALKSDHASENSFGDYPRIEPDLYGWSVGGIGEYHDFKRYKTQLAQTTKVLADLYAKQFGWSMSRSLKLAQLATTNAISQGFGFYMYNPYSSYAEVALRAAILEHRPMAEIKAIQFDSKLVDIQGGDSILNVAVEYPAALRYLLDKGINPNTTNPFGKTPLMYAAQFNQISATKILLSAGADPNAATILPNDDCSYTIRTTHMTALHYAARYASLSLIKLLVKNGAVTFSQTHNEDNSKKDEYPIDWLRKYVMTATAAGQNPNITTTDGKVAADLLHVASDIERHHIAESMVLHAESDYAIGKVESAYRSLQIAISAQPNNKKAVADLPLIALKLGQIGPAIKAADKAIDVLKEPSLRAAAWFNKGLICEQEAPHTLDYDGSRCDTDWILPFVRAWKLAATPARAKKLRGFFSTDKTAVCTFSLPQSEDQRVRIQRDYVTYNDKNSGVQRIYILHRAEDNIDPATIQWPVTYADKRKASVLTPNVVDQLKLGSDMITILEGEDNGRFPMISEQPWCAK